MRYAAALLVMMLFLPGNAQAENDYSTVVGIDPLTQRPMVRAARWTRMPARKFRKKMVPYQTSEKPGTIIIDTKARFLYYVMGNGRAMRYGIGVGREGFGWTGTERITRKAEWPDWRPPAEMRRRQSELPAFVPGGPENPMGARALYLGHTLYRIHGTNEAWSIGYAVSSGCIRMLNDDVIELYERAKRGAKVIVL